MNAAALRLPSNAMLLDTWEEGSRQHPLDRALTLLRAFTDCARAPLAQLSIGERDQLLLEIRRRFFGERLEALCACERCGEPNEFAIDAGALPLREAPAATTIAVVTARGEITARLPNSIDLAAVIALDEDEAARTLVERCLLSGGAAADAEDRARLEAAMERAEGLAALDIAFACSVCGADNAAPFEAENFVWNEVASVARRLLLDVDTLAAAYGWSESAVLALGGERRAAYVKLARR